jgi:hypothetical protein
MDLTKVLEQLHAELNYLNAAIASLQRLQQGDLEGRDGRIGYKRPAGRPTLALEKRNQIPADANPETP